MNRGFEFLRQHGVSGILRRIIPEEIRRGIRREASAFTARWRREEIRSWKREVARIVQEHPQAREVFLFPPSLRWDAGLFQRPQHLARALARAGALVFYLEGRGSRLEADVHFLEENLVLCNAHPTVFDVLEDPVVYILTWNLGYLDSLPSHRVLYDFVDDLEVFHFYDHDVLRREHLALLKKAELVTVTAQSLFDEIEAQRPDAHYCPNGVDYDHFQISEEQKLEPPEDVLSILEEGKPIVGYYGALARWLDYDLLACVAEMRRDLNFLLIGPDYDGSMLRSGLTRISNIHWLRERPYVQIPRYLNVFDVATIPFEVSQITNAVSPLKLFEYMAGGKPVVTTAMAESMRYPGVLVSKDCGDFAHQLDLALTLKDDAGYLKTIDRTARQNTWTLRAQQILEAIGKNRNQVSGKTGDRISR